VSILSLMGSDDVGNDRKRVDHGIPSKKLRQDHSGQRRLESGNTFFSLEERGEEKGVIVEKRGEDGIK